MASSPSPDRNDDDEGRPSGGRSKLDLSATLLADDILMSDDDDDDDELLYKPVVFRSSASQRESVQTTPTATQEEDPRPGEGGLGCSQGSLLSSSSSSPSSTLPPLQGRERLSLLSSSSQPSSVARDAPPLSAEALERADKRAREYVQKDTMELAKCDNLSDVCWVFDKDRRYPVVLAPPAMLLLSQSLTNRSKLADGKTVGVVFLGMAYSGSWEEGMYPRRALKPYDYVEPSTSSGRRGGDDARDDDASKSHDHGDGEGEIRWNPALMDRYIKSLARLKDFRDPKTGAVDREKLEVERAYLKHALLRIRTNQLDKEEKRQQREREIQEAEESELDDGDDGPPSQQPPQSRPAPLVPDQENSSAHADVAGGVVAATGSQTSRPKIRAGDRIRYIPPNLKAAAINERAAVVTEVKTKSDDVVLVLSTGDLLSVDDQVCVTHRAIRNGLVSIDRKNQRFLSLHKYVLDQSRNGKVQADAQPNLAAESFERTKQEMLALVREAAADGDPEPAVDVPAFEAEGRDGEADAEQNLAGTAPSAPRRSGPPRETDPNAPGSAAAKKRALDGAGAKPRLDAGEQASSAGDVGPVPKKRRSARLSLS